MQYMCYVMVDGGGRGSADDIYQYVSSHQFPVTLAIVGPDIPGQYSL